MDFATSALALPLNLDDHSRERSPWTQERLAYSTLAFSVEPSSVDHRQCLDHALHDRRHEPHVYDGDVVALPSDFGAPGSGWPSCTSFNDDHRSSPWQLPMASPSDAGLTSSYPSSLLSDSQSPPWHSPPLTTLSFAGDPAGFHYQRLGLVNDTWHSNDDSYVAPCEVQHAADSDNDYVAFDDDTAAYPLYGTYAHDAQEGYHPIKGEDSPNADLHSLTVDETSGMGNSAANTDIPNLRRRRVQDTYPKSCGTSHVSRVTKRSSTSSLLIRDPSRPFVCPFALYGCRSSFGSKNEWKRHVNTQHMRLGFWRCDQCPTGDRRLHNDFNRKDLFVQHVRRMHPAIVAATATADGPSNRAPKLGSKVAISKPSAAAASEYEERQLAVIAARCYKHLRSPPQSTGCLFCEVTFSSPRTWDERMEHVGRHMETMKKGDEELVHPSEWRDDDDMEDWLASEGLIARHGKGWALTERKL